MVPPTPKRMMWRVTEAPWREGCRGHCAVPLGCEPTAEAHTCELVVPWSIAPNTSPPPPSSSTAAAAAAPASSTFTCVLQMCVCVCMCSYTCTISMCVCVLVFKHACVCAGVWMLVHTHIQVWNSKYAPSPAIHHSCAPFLSNPVYPF